MRFLFYRLLVEMNCFFVSVNICRLYKRFVFSFYIIPRRLRVRADIKTKKRNFLSFVILNIRLTCIGDEASVLATRTNVDNTFIVITCKSTPIRRGSICQTDQL